MKTPCSALIAFVALALSGSAAQAGHSSGHRITAKQPEETKASLSQHADIRKHNACPHCGMDREKFAYSRMLITYSNGFSVGVCSVHCAVMELKASKSKLVKTIEVADFQTKKMIPADKAIWVYGGSRKGVMSAAPKWAFSTREAANAFIRANGGTITTFKDVLSSAEKDCLPK